MTMHDARLHIPARRRLLTKREGGIERLLVWAFKAEKAQFTHPQEPKLERPAPRWGLEYVAMRQAELGADIDGGGYSHPHDDAETVAAAVSALPWDVAVMIAECARADMRPLGRSCEKPRYSPRAWKKTAYGMTAETEVVERVETKARGRRGRRSSREVRACPVVLRPTRTQVHADRETYIRWLMALLDLSVNLARSGRLREWILTTDLPPEAPWAKRE